MTAGGSSFLLMFGNSEHKSVITAARGFFPLPRSPQFLPGAHGQAVTWGEQPGGMIWSQTKDLYLFNLGQKKGATTWGPFLLITHPGVHKLLEGSEIPASFAQLLCSAST